MNNNVYNESILDERTVLRGQGDPDLWDDIWQTSEQLYLNVNSAPQTLSQLWQRCYFEDLWHLKQQSLSDRYLELGSGRGTTSMYLLANGCDVTMVDLAPTAFRLAKACCEQNTLKQPNFLLADVRDTRLLSESYDCIYNIGLLEHFEDPYPVLVEAFRLLKPGGLIFMVIVPKVSFRRKLFSLFLFNPWRLLKMTLGMTRRYLFKTRSAPTSPMTRTNYSRTQYEQMLCRLGAKKVQCLPYNPYHPVYQNKKMEECLSVPIYRMHYKLKQKMRHPLNLQTKHTFALCYLLVGWK